MRTLSAEQQFVTDGPVTEPQYLIEITLDQPYYWSTRSDTEHNGNTYTVGAVQLGAVSGDRAELRVDNHGYAYTQGALDGTYLRQPCRVLWAYGALPVASAEPVQADESFDADTGWTLGDGWSIATGEAYAVDPGAESLLTASMTPLSVGADYTITLVIDALYTGSVSVECDGVEVIAAQTSAGTYAGAYTPVAGAEELQIIASSDFQGDLASVSVQQDGAVGVPDPIVIFDGIINATPDINEWLSVSCSKTPPRLYPFRKLRPPLANFTPSAGYVVEFDGAILRIEGQR